MLEMLRERFIYCALRLVGHVGPLFDPKVVPWFISHFPGKPPQRPQFTQCDSSLRERFLVLFLRHIHHVFNSILEFGHVVESFLAKHCDGFVVRLSG